MKRTISLICLGTLLSLKGFAGTPIETLVPVDHVYGPQGFDTNDTTEIIISGYLPNLCHKSPFTDVKTTGNNIDISVKALKYDASNPFCPEVIVPFIEVVKVGVLDKGNYKITVNGKSMYEKKGQIAVTESTSDAIDDFSYANVEYVEKIAGSRTVKLKGYNPSDCFQLESVEFVDNGTDTYSVLPKMKRISDFCPMKLVPFTYETEVPTKLTADKVLLHVRVMDGKSVNSIYMNDRE